MLTSGGSTPSGSAGCGAAGALALAFVLGLAAHADTITGVCPDGSVFVVTSEEAIPCARAKRVAPHQVPPIRPQYLPRPYTWHVYEQSGDPNNPYNLIDAARRIRELREGRAQATRGRPQGEATLPPPVAARAGATVTGPRRAALAAPRSLGLSPDELRDLFAIVELSQRVAPLSFVRERANGEEVLRVQLARSRAFEGRLLGASPAGSASGAVFLFTAVAREATPFHANFTFVQGHLAFHPDTDDPAEFGLLQGHLGQLEAGEAVLGYLVLPASLDPSAPLDVYWNDRRAHLTPPR